MSKIKKKIKISILDILSVTLLIVLIMKGALNSFAEIISLILLMILFLYVTYLFRKYRGKNDNK